MNHRKSLSLSLVLATLSCTSSALAGEDAPSKAPTREVWYGWQTLSTDVASVALGIGVGQSDGSAGGYTFLGGYLLGGPLVHLFHEQYGKAGTSFGLRVGLPLVLGLGGAMMGESTCKDKNVYCSTFMGSVGGVLGVFGGILGASLADMAFLARKSEPVQQEARWTPILAPQRDGLVLGAAGRW
jgi:hypothetical protein